MHISVPKNSFTQAVLLGERSVGKNTNTPILGSILLEAHKDTVTLRATNLDVGIAVTIPAQVKKEGVVALPAGLLKGFLTAHTADEALTLTADSGTVSLTTTHHTARIQTLPTEDFPEITMPNTKLFSVEASQLVSGLRSVWFAASTSDVKPELGSVFVNFAGGNIVFAATDSFRLAEKNIPLKQPLTHTPLLIPRKNVAEIISLLETYTGKDPIPVYGNENQIGFRVGGATLVSRVVSGTFPDYGQIIPKEHSTEATLLKHDLTDALKVANVFSNTFQKLRCIVKPSEKTLHFETQSPNVGESTVALEAALSGDDLDISFNHKYIADSLQSLSGDSVTLHFSGAGKPVVIRSVGDSSFTYLVMPMNK